MEHDIPELLRALCMLITRQHFEEAEKFIYAHFGRRKKKKKHKAVEGKHGDGI
jgi:hypothetical protein